MYGMWTLAQVSVGEQKIKTKICGMYVCEGIVLVYIWT